MEAAIWTLALLFVVFVALGAYVGLKLLAAAKRGVDRTVAQARRHVEDASLRARQYTTAGAVSELARLRLSLRSSMRATQEALQAAPADDRSLSEAASLFERLSVHGRELDDELRSLERDPDAARVGERLPELRERTSRVTQSADSLRWAARDRARQFAKDDLTELSRQIDLESGALRPWTQDGGPDAWVGGPDTAGSHGADTADARGADTAGSRDPSASSPEPRPITARDPRRNAAYSWQKTRRPEGTN